MLLVLLPAFVLLEEQELTFNAEEGKENVTRGDSLEAAGGTQKLFICNLPEIMEHGTRTLRTSCRCPSDAPEESPGTQGPHDSSEVLSTSSL